MDPFNVAATTSGLLGAYAAVSRTVDEMKEKYDSTDILGLISEKCTKASSTLSEIQDFLQADSRLFYERLQRDGVKLDMALKNAFECHGVALVAMNEALNKCQQNASHITLSGTEKKRLPIRESDRMDLSKHWSGLGTLNIALDAVCSAIIVDEIGTMKLILYRETAALESVKIKTSNLRKDYAPSIISKTTTVFDFDSETISTDAYQRAYKAFTKNSETSQGSSSDSANPTTVHAADMTSRQHYQDPTEAVLSDNIGNDNHPSKPLEVRSKADMTNQALWHAVKKGRCEVVRALLRRNADITSKVGKRLPIVEAARLGYCDILELLLDQDGADIDAVDDYGKTALYSAALHDKDETVRLLLGRGAEAILERYNGYTPIACAAKKGYLKVVEALLTVPGINLETISKNVNTPLYYAADKGYIEIVRVLLDSGAKPGLQMHGGLTATDAAAVAGHTEIVELLLDYS